MKKHILFIAALTLISGMATAQISQGAPHSSNFRTGNRPEAGNWGIFIGPSMTEVIDLIDWAGGSAGGINVVRGLPLINGKYYWTDKLEFRMGLQYYSKAYRTDGKTLGENSASTSSDDAESFFHLTPGAAWHFSSKNLLDVYGGAYIPLGYESRLLNSEVGTYVASLERSSFVLGLGFFIGVQAFVADLPLSIGLEYGIDGTLRTGRVDKLVVTDINGNDQTSYAPYGTGVQGVAGDYKSLSAHENVIGTNLRLTITYYFTNK